MDKRQAAERSRSLDFVWDFVGRKREGDVKNLIEKKVNANSKNHR